MHNIGLSLALGYLKLQKKLGFYSILIKHRKSIYDRCPKIQGKIFISCTYGQKHKARGVLKMQRGQLDPALHMTAKQLS